MIKDFSFCADMVAHVVFFRFLMFLRCGLCSLSFVFFNGNMMWGLVGSWFFMHFYYNVEDSVVLVGLNCSFCYIIVGLNLVLIVLACGLVS